MRIYPSMNSPSFINITGQHQANTDLKAHANNESSDQLLESNQSEQVEQLAKGKKNNEYSIGKKQWA